jgi:hypothetical protein
MKSSDFLNEKWSKKYKRSINCSHPRGFSQRAHCAGRNKNEDVELDTEGVAENQTDDELFGSGGDYKRRLKQRIDDLFGEIYDHGDSGLDYLDRGPVYHRLWEKYSNESDPMAAVFDGESTEVLKALAEEMAEILDELNSGFAESTAGISKRKENQFHVKLDKLVHNTFGHSSEEMKEADAELAEPPEPERKQTTKTKDKPKFDFDPFQQKADQPLAKADPLDDLKRNAGVHDKTKVNLRKAGQKTTLDKTAGIGSPEMGDMLSRMRNIDIDPELEPYQQDEPEDLPSVEVNTANLPAVAGQALQAAGTQNPEFHQVANLPGNMADQIRQLGKSLFGSLTMTPTKRIYVVANLGGQGPNTNQEVQAVANFLKEHGDDRGPGDIDFDNVMPGYSAQTHMYTAAGIRWMLVKDFAGQYIYCWPEADSHDASDAIGHDTDVKRLR